MSEYVNTISKKSVGFDNLKSMARVQIGIKREGKIFPFSIHLRKKNELILCAKNYNSFTVVYKSTKIYLLQATPHLCSINTHKISQITDIFFNQQKVFITFSSK